MGKKSFWDNPKIKNSRERLIIIFGILILVFCSYNLAFTNRIFPNVFVAGINLSGKSQLEAIKQLGQKIKIPEKITLNNENQAFEITAEAINLSVDLTKSANAAFAIYRSGNLFLDFYQRILSPFKKASLGLRISKDENKLDTLISTVAGQVGQEPVYPSLKTSAGKVTVEKGKVGYELDRNLLKIKIGEAFSFASNQPIPLPLTKIDPTLSEQQAQNYQERGEKLLGKRLVLNYDLQTFNYRGAELFKYLDPKKEYRKNEITELVETVANELDRQPQDSVFVFENNSVQEFAPAKDGIMVKQDLLSEMILGNLRSLEQGTETIVSITIPATLTPPAVKTGDINHLGIKELLGRGVSYFAGSIASRIHNIKLASSKFRGILVAPGETLSFNKTLGDVSEFTGYKQAYIIKDGKTILGDGGGVCQVSTTFFRAALEAGLPILQRQAHAYRVGYYEQGFPPGLDATVYDPTADLKIKNDTANHILIQPEVDLKKLRLVFEFYGTNDGRISRTTKPVMTEVTPPPDDVYQDDPTLPAGQIKQIEHKAWGAKVTFKYTVEKDGQTIFQKTFVSNYRPWAAVYLRGTGPVQ